MRYSVVKHRTFHVVEQTRNKFTRSLRCTNEQDTSTEIDFRRNNAATAMTSGLDSSGLDTSLNPKP